MRGGKRGTTTSVNTTPITLRSCAVRGEKSTTAASATTRTPGTLKTNHNASANSTLKQKSLRSRRSSTPQQQESQSQHGGGGEERKFRGPLKKRPITANISSAPSGSTSTTITTRRDASTSKTPTQIVIVKQKLKQAVPTVAASRSRRAIKPNPKYTSEDMVTPRMIKNVASGGTITLSDGSVKRRHPSTSSSEHFFSRESSAEFGAEFQEILQRKSMNDSDKDYNTDTETQPQQNQQQHTNATTNTSELRSSDSPAVGTRKRGRPRRELQPTTDSPTEDKTAASKAQAHDNAVVTKTRSGTPLVQKRKLANEKEISGQDLNVTSKRFVLPSSIAKKFTTNDHNTDDDFENDDDDDDNDDDDDIDDDDDDEDYHIDEPKKRTLHKTTNIGATKPIKKTNTTTSTMKTTKETNLKNEPNEETVDDPPVVEDIVISSNVSNRRKQQFNKRPPTTVPLKSNDVRGSSHTSSIETTTKSTTNNSNNNNSKNINNIRANANKSVQQESSVSALRKETNNNIKQHNNNNNNNNKNNNNNTIVTKESSDASGMPCFTIVNINDIISKKGDVMMSKSSADDIVIKSNLASRTKTSDIINGRRDDKVLASVEKKLLTTSRPPQTILNHQLATRNQLTSNLKKKTTVEQKPAPRILNAMVAKKTQPVKPVTANPNDSADDSLISLDGDDHDFDGEDGIGGSKNNEFNNTFPSSLNLSSNDGDDFEPDMDDLDFDDDDDIDMRIKELKRKAQKSRDSRSFNNKVLDKKRLVTSTPSTSSSKENKLPTGQHQIQKSADGVTVEIIHQGGKTITKETSVQDWFVAKRNTHPPKRPLPLEKNTLKMPIIDLANMAVDLQLPSKHWNSKVTLYELPASQLAKGSYTTYKGSLSEYNNITEEDRHKFQPSCVMFRRAVHENEKVRLPYDRAVIFKNNTFFINIDGKNVVLASAPSEVETQEDVEILLDIVDFLTLTSMHVELASSI